MEDVELSEDNSDQGRGNSEDTETMQDSSPDERRLTEEAKVSPRSFSVYRQSSLGVDSPPPFQLIVADPTMEDFPANVPGASGKRLLKASKRKKFEKSRSFHAD